jgi:hypothetical protein
MIALEQLIEPLLLLGRQRNTASLQTLQARIGNTDPGGEQACSEKPSGTEKNGPPSNTRSG